MENKSLRNALISAGVAVSAGVLLLGVNAAIGNTPTHEPPGTDVSPTFSGLTVDGSADVDQGITADWINVSTGIWNGATGPVKITDNEGILLSGGLNLTGPIKNSSAAVPEPVTIDDQLEVTGYISNPSENIGPNPDNPVWIGEDLSVEGKVTADEVGSFTIRKKPRKSVGPGVNTMEIANCEDDEIIMSCGFESYTSMDGDVISTMVSLQQIWRGDDPNSCTVGAYNLSEVNTNFWEAYAVCFASGG